MHPDLKTSQRRKAAWGDLAGRALLFLCLAAALSLTPTLPVLGQGSVKTIGGGPNTFNSGMRPPTPRKYNGLMYNNDSSIGITSSVPWMTCDPC